MAHLQLPKIDFSGLNHRLDGTPEWNTVRAAAMHALETYGSFEASFDRISLQLREAVFGEAMTDVLSLPPETKSRSPGYLDNRTLEALDSVAVLDAATFQGFQRFASLLWPQGDPHFCETTWSYAKEIIELDRMIQRMIVESLGFDTKHYDYLINNTKYALRLSSYKVPGADARHHGEQEEMEVFPAHTDPNLVTIVGQHRLGGIEVQTKRGEWVRPVPSSYSFIVLLGDSMEAWTNGRLQATRHRVMMNGNGDTRRSTISSSTPRDGLMIQAPAELLDDTHPALYKPFDFAEFYRFRYTQEALNAKSALKAFCGVHACHFSLE